MAIFICGKSISKSRLMEKIKYKAIDLFAGIGGIRIGFEQIFGDCIRFVFSNEIDNYSCKTYESNFGDSPKGDITKINPSELPDFDLLLAGFPCQSFSIAGKKRGFEDIRGTLFFNVADILRIKQPSAFLLENVKHLVNHDSGRTFQVIRDVLETDLGYHIHYKVLNAKDFGVPQNRERIFIVGFRDNYQFQFPNSTKIPVKIADILENKVDEKYYLSQEYLSGLKRHRARHEAKGNGFGYEIIPRDGIANSIVCGGMGRERNLVKDIIPSNCWKGDGDSIRLRNGEGIRKMTPMEWARLQGFPENFKFPVSMTQQYKQLGNSVAVPVIKAIANQMKLILDNGDKRDNGGKPESQDLTEDEKLCLSLLTTMYQRKKNTKSGKKSMQSLSRLINDHALRIDDLGSLIQRMEKSGIVLNSNENNIFFNTETFNVYSVNEFQKIVIKKLKEGIRVL